MTGRIIHESDHAITVAELISRLEDFPQDALVYCTSEDWRRIMVYVPGAGANLGYIDTPLPADGR